jgi:hypothetical protein
VLQQDDACKNPGVCDFNFAAFTVMECTIIIAKAVTFHWKLFRLKSFEWNYTFVTFFAKYKMANK